MFSGSPRPRQGKAELVGVTASRSQLPDQEEGSADTSLVSGRSRLDAMVLHSTWEPRTF